MKRPSMFARKASPRPVPAAITAALPPGCATPCCSTFTSSGCSTATEWAMASRSLRMCTRRSAAASAIAAPSASGCAGRGAFDEPRHVGEARDLIGHRTGDAEAGAGDRARLHALRLEELPDHRHETVVVERDEIADLDLVGPLRRFLEESEQRLGSSDVGREQHRRYYD